MQASLPSVISIAPSLYKSKFIGSSNRSIYFISVTTPRVTSSQLSVSTLSRNSSQLAESWNCLERLPLFSLLYLLYATDTFNSTFPLKIVSFAGFGETFF